MTSHPKATDWRCPPDEHERPRAFLLENVFGLAYRNHNAFWFKRLLSMFRRLGYHVDHRVLLAADYGVPQRRQRLFIVGSRDAEPVPMSGEPTPRSFAGAGQR